MKERYSPLRDITNDAHSKPKLATGVIGIWKTGKSNIRFTPPLLQNGCYVSQSAHHPVPNSFSLRICSPEMQAKSAERAFGYRPSDSHPCPAGTKSNHCYGRSSDSSRSPRLPGKNQWQRVRMNRFSRKRGTYSSEHCSGFSPDSLLIPADDSARKTNNGTKILFFSVHYLHFRKNSDHQVRKQYFMSFRNADKNTRPKKLENTCENILRIVVIFWKHTPIRTRRPRRVSGPTYSLL